MTETLFNLTGCAHFDCTICAPIRSSYHRSLKRMSAIRRSRAHGDECDTTSGDWLSPEHKETWSYNALAELPLLVLQHIFFHLGVEELPAIVNSIWTSKSMMRKTMQTIPTCLLRCFFSYLAPVFAPLSNRRKFRLIDALARGADNIYVLDYPILDLFNRNFSNIEALSDNGRPDDGRHLVSTSDRGSFRVDIRAYRYGCDIVVRGTTPSGPYFREWRFNTPANGTFFTLALATRTANCNWLCTAMHRWYISKWIIWQQAHKRARTNPSATPNMRASQLTTISLRARG